MVKLAASSAVLRVIFALFFASSDAALAQVIITQPTNGAISNDLATLSPLGGSYTTLTNIVITDQAEGDFAPGIAKRIRLDLPTGWQLRTTSVTLGKDGSNLSNLAIHSFSSTNIIISYDVSGNPIQGNSLIISGLQVQSTNSTVGGPAYLTRANTAEQSVINGLPNGAILATLAKHAGLPSSLQTLLPGQTNLPGTISGKSGTASSQTAGVNFSVVVNIVDYAFNICTNTSPQNISLTTTNPYHNIPSPLNSTSGTTVFEVLLKTARPTTTTSYTFTAHDLTDGTVEPNISSNLSVLAGGYVKLLIVMPGEDYLPGSPAGKTGTYIPWVSNRDNSLTVYAVDKCWNKVSSVTNTIVISSTDTDVSLPADNTLSLGSRVFTVRLRTITANNTITATDQTTGFESTSAVVNVITGAYTKLQILLPGETNAPNTSSGKIGTPFNGAPPIAGSSFNVVVNAVDANWNLVITVTNSVTITHSNLAYTSASVLPATAALVSGTKTFAITLKRAISQMIRVSDADPSKTSVISSSIVVAAGAFVKLQLLLPGESADPGTALGKKGVSLTRFAGVAFSSSVVNAVDEHWNKVLGVNDDIKITTSTFGATVPKSLSLSNGSRKNFSINLRVLGTTTVTVTNTSNSSIFGSSDNVLVISAGFAKLQVLLPGEVAAPGTVTGKTVGIPPHPQDAGMPFNITVNAVDAGWNLINTVTDEVKLTSSDVNATMPDDAKLSGGTMTFSVMLITAGSKTIKTIDITNGAKTANTSAKVVVNPRSYFQLLALLPSQSNVPGTLDGISGNPAIPARGVAFNIQVRAVDQYFNPVNGITNELTFSSSDGSAILPATTSLLASSFRVSSFTITNPGIQTVTINDPIAGKSVTVNIPNPTPLSLATNYFRTVVSGLWTDAATWESSVDNIVWHAATIVPMTTANKITILSPHIVEVLSTGNADQITIDEGAELVVGGGTFTVEDGADAIDLQVNGKLTGTNSGVITSGGIISIANGATYQHNYTSASGTIPTAIWTIGSRCEVTGYTSWIGSIDGSGQHFSDFLWDCESQNNPNSGPTLLANFQARDLTVSNTGAGTLNLNSAIINGNFELINGNVALISSAVINVAGDLKLLDGTLSKGSGSAATLNFSGSTVTQQFVNAGVVMSGAINFNINPNAKVNFGVNELEGTSGSFNLSQGATIMTANLDGLAVQGGDSGTIQNTGSRSFSAVANYIYNGNAQQVAGTGLPQTLNNLTINNIFGVIMPSGVATYNVNGALIIDGFLDMKEHPLKGNFTLSGPGTLMSGAMNAFATHKTWEVNVEYNSATAQNIIGGNYSKSFKTSNAGPKIGPSGVLNVAGDWSSNNGEVDLITNNTILSFNGSTTQSLTDASSNGGLGLQFYNVNFSNSGVKTLTSGKFNLAPTGLLTMATGATLVVNSKLILKSTLTNSATIAAIPASAQINGNVEVQRFITGGPQNPYRTYRMLSSPIYTNASPLSRTYSFAEFKDDMIVTGSGGAANGFDSNASNSASAWTYNGGFVPVTHITTTLDVGRGAYLFYRGNRLTPKTTFPYPDPENLVMNFVGLLNQQDVNVPLIAGFNLVGNPYASSIDWNSAGIIKTNLANNVIRIWIPASRAYSTYDGLIAVPETVASNIIASGQGFFVEGAASSPTSLKFTESAKINTQLSTLLLSAPTNDRLTFNGVTSKNRFDFQASAVPHTDLRLTLIASGSSFMEQTAVVFKRGKSGEFNVSEDASYFSGGSEQKVFLSSRSADDTDLTINYMPEVSPTSQVKFNINKLNKAGDYKLLINYKDVPSGYMLKINDSYLATSTFALNGDSYMFTIDKGSPNTFGPDRFSVSFEAPTTLPLMLSSFTAVKVNEGVMVKWKSTIETNQRRFVLERAGEDRLFLNLYTVAAKGNGSAYNFLDKLPLLGNNYYRLVEVTNDEKLMATAPIVINYKGITTSNTLAVFPNPIKEEFIIKYDGVLRVGQHRIEMVGVAGKMLFTKLVTSSGLAKGYQFNIANYTAGIYILRLFESGGREVAQIKLLKE